MPVSGQEVRELYRAVLLREPEPEAVTGWSGRSDITYEGLRNGLFESEEFKIVQARIANQRPSLMSSPDHSRAALARLLKLSDATPVQLSSDSSADHRLISALGDLASPGLVVAFGGEAADTLALVVAGLLKIVALSATPGTPRDGLTRLPFRTDALTAMLKSNGVGIGVAIVGPDLPPEEAMSVYQSLPERGVMLCLNDVAQATKDALERQRALVWGELLNGDQFKLITRALWPFRVDYRPAMEGEVQLGRRKIAVGAIVKNEEAELPGMIRSCAGLADRLVLLDTGSTDRTIEVARQACEAWDIPLEIHQAGFVDFANARNSLIALMPSDIEWVLMLDADERLMPADQQGLIDIAEADSASAAILPRYNILRETPEPLLGRYPDRQARFFKITGSTKPHYVNPVHEALIVEGPVLFPPLNGASFGGRTGGPHIHHRVFSKVATHDTRDALYAALSTKQNNGE